MAASASAGSQHARRDDIVSPLVPRAKRCIRPGRFQPAAAFIAAWRMIPKSGYRFSDQIMRKA
jgi:hypothetical protein